MSHTDDMSRLTGAMRASYESRVAAVGAMQAATGLQLAELRVQRREAAAAQHQELARSSELLRREGANRQHDLRVERAALGADQRSRLGAYRSNLRQDLGRFLSARSTARSAEREQQRQRLTSAMEALQASTSACLADASRARKAIHDDHAGARAAWRQFNGEMRQRRAGH